MESEVKEVVAYQTSDGTLYTDSHKAILHQKKIDKKKKIVGWVDKYCWSDISKEDLVDILMENLDDLIGVVGSKA